MKWLLEQFSYLPTVRDAAAWVGAGGSEILAGCLLPLPTYLLGLSLKEVASGVEIPPSHGEQWFLWP